jgi:hypothetical protein
MKQKLFYLFVIFLSLVYGACNDGNVDVPTDPVEFLPYEEVKTSFSISEDGYSFEENYSFCDQPNRVDLELSYGGSSGGYFYVSGFGYDLPENDVSEILVRFFGRGLEAINSSTFELESILNLYENYPDRCFVNLTLEYRGKRYSCVHYEITPFEKEIKDPDSIYEYHFLEDPMTMECFDNWPVAPLEFEYDGFLYTHDRQDSIKVSNFKSSFLIVKSY